jgi:hypothetical protein
MERRRRRVPMNINQIINQIMLGDEIEFDRVFKSQGAQDGYIVHYHGVVVGLKRDRSGSICEIELARNGISNPLNMRFTPVDNFRLIHRMDQARWSPTESRSNPTPGGQ